MTTPVFPTLPSGEASDSSKFEVAKTDPSMRAEMEGSYVVSRARHTRKPLRIFKTGYTGINNADKAVLDNFYDTVRGGSVVFSWTDPTSLLVYSVRFKGALGFKYVGFGLNQMWDCAFELEQA